jgi:hypothetical protein
MGVGLNSWGKGLLIGALISGSSGAIATAQPQNEGVGRLDRPTIPEVVDRNVKLNSFWDYATTSGDTKFLFSITRQEQEITNSGFRAEVLYRDLLQQQDDNNPTLRTQDLPSPFSTSVFQLRSFPGQ